MVFPAMHICINHVLFIFSCFCLLYEWNNLASSTQYYVFTFIHIVTCRTDDQISSMTSKHRALIAQSLLLSFLWKNSVVSDSSYKVPNAITIITNLYQAFSMGQVLCSLLYTGSQLFFTELQRLVILLSIYKPEMTGVLKMNSRARFEFKAMFSLDTPLRLLIAVHWLS